MFNHILLTTDGSILSQAEIQKGVKPAKSMKARITGIGVMPEDKFQLGSLHQHFCKCGVQRLYNSGAWRWNKNVTDSEGFKNRGQRQYHRLGAGDLSDDSVRNKEFAGPSFLTEGYSHQLFRTDQIFRNMKTTASLFNGAYQPDRTAQARIGRLIARVGAQL